MMKKSLVRVFVFVFAVSLVLKILPQSTIYSIY